MKKRMLVAAGLLALSSAVNAEVLLSEIYLAADIGSLTAPGYTANGSNAMMSSDEAARLTLGLREPGQGWGAELSYLNKSGGGSCGCGSSLGDKELGAVDAIQVYGTYTHRVADRLALFGKLGIVNTKYEAGTAPGLIAHNSGSRLGAGIGAQFDLFKRFGVRVQYELFGTDSSYGGPDRMRYLSVGGIFRFR